MMWKDKYKIGVELIDNQHMELFKRVSDFIAVVQSKEDWESKSEKAKETMEFMQDYVIVHFNDEEKYQAKIKYPDIEEHKKAHADFKNGIYEYSRIFSNEGITQEKTQELAGKLMAWLIMHVAKMDQKIGEYVSRTGGSIQ